MVNSKPTATVLTSHENTFKTQHTVLTQFSSSGRSVTIRLHGPAANAIQPVSLHVSEVLLNINCIDCQILFLH